MQVCGEVVKIKNSLAYVRTARPTSCEGCANAGLCSKESVELTAINEVGAEVGDKVEIEADESRSAIWVIAYIFLIPIVILFVGTFLFSIFPWLSLICVPLLCIYFVGLKRMNHSWKPANRIVTIKEKYSSRI